MERPAPLLPIRSFYRFILPALLFAPPTVTQAADLFDKSNLSA